MRNARLRRMSANVSANRDNSSLIRDIPDLINALGDAVCTRYAEARPDLMRRLGFDVDYNARVAAQNRDNNQGEDSTDTKRSANTLLARLIMLPVAMQEQVMNELTAEFNATVQEMGGTAEHPTPPPE